MDAQKTLKIRIPKMWQRRMIELPWMADRRKCDKALGKPEHEAEILTYVC